MEVSDQFHAPEALLPAKVPVLIGWTPEPVWTRWESNVLQT